MFGYVVVNKPELKFREFDVYRAYYCGLCHSLSKRHGLSGQLTLSYDMTFLVILLSSLYEPEHSVTSKRCIVHPIKRQNIISSEFTDYVADMNVILSYFKCLDDWHDDRSVLKLAYSKLLKKGSIGKNLNNVHATSDSTDDGSVAATQPSAVDDGSVAALSQILTVTIRILILLTILGICIFLLIIPIKIKSKLFHLCWTNSVPAKK